MAGNDPRGAEISLARTRLKSEPVPYLAASGSFAFPSMTFSLRILLTAGLLSTGLPGASSSAWAAATPAVVKVNRAKVRAQPSAHSEVLTHLKQGDRVTILAEQSDPEARAGEPRQWARIEMPEHVPVWLAANLIDPKSKKVKVDRINLRAGPGKNFSQLGQLPKGTEVSDIRSEDGWMQIEAPPGCVAYMAVDLLAPGTERAATNRSAASPPPPVVLNPKPRVRSEVIAPQPIESVTPPPVSVPGNAVAEPNPTRGALPNEIARVEPVPYKPVAVARPVSNPAAVQPRVASDAGQPEPGPRVVNREGLVGHAWSVQAPSYLELRSSRRHEGLINFLFTDDPKIDLEPFRKKHVVLTGEEWIDPRWPKTPILRVQKIEALDY